MEIVEKKNRFDFIINPNESISFLKDLSEIQMNSKTVSTSFKTNEKSVQQMADVLNDLIYQKTEITCLVKYRKTISAGHALLDDHVITKTEVVKVSDLLDLNDMFSSIEDVKIIEDNRNTDVRFKSSILIAKIIEMLAYASEEKYFEMDLRQKANFTNRWIDKILKHSNKN